MKKILVIPIVIALVLALGAGAVFAYIAWTGTASVTVSWALNVSWADRPDETLILENKDSQWAVTPNDGISGVLTYNLAGATFDYTLVASGLTPTTGYTLIYYADKPNRTVNWGGDNPGAWIAAATTDGAGDLSVSGSKALPGNINLPNAPDANMYLYDYTQPPDNYPTATGAKIWLVPSSCYDTNAMKVTSWQPTSFLFETELITYRYSTGAGMGFTGNTVTVTDLMPGETWNFEITIQNLSTASINVVLTPNDPRPNHVRMDVGGGPGQPNNMTVSGLGTVVINGSIIASQSADPSLSYVFTVAVSR